MTVARYIFPNLIKQRAKFIDPGGSYRRYKCKDCVAHLLWSPVLFAGVKFKDQTIRKRTVIADTTTTPRNPAQIW